MTTSRRGWDIYGCKGRILSLFSHSKDGFITTVEVRESSQEYRVNTKDEKVKPTVTILILKETG